MLRRFKELIVAITLLPLLVQPALAHVVWFDSKGEEYELLFGHPESGPEPYDVSKFLSATAYDRNKQVVSLDINVQDVVSVNPQGEIAALTAFYDNGFWLRTPDDDYQNISKEEAEAINYTNVTNFLKSTKALYDWSETISQPFDLPLEIMALENPFEVVTGELLPIQVLFEGNLINNALVEYIGQTVAVNSDGIAYIPIGEEGLQPIEASYTDPSATNPGISYATTLTAERTVPEPSALLGIIALSVLTFMSKGKQKKAV